MQSAARAGRLEFRVLGPLEMEVDGTPVALTGERQRSLLALLLLRVNEFVSSERVLDELWNEDPPPSAQASLRVAVSKLRGLLGDDHRRALETLPGGYRLRLDPMQVDSHRFEELVDEARAQEDAGRAAELLGEAVDLWRGPPFADLAYASFVQN